MSKPLHPGHAADAGALAAIGAAAGVTGALDVLHGPVGFAAATSEDTGKWEKALAGLDERFAITAMTFKNHGCCGHIFAGLDAVAACARSTASAPEDVEGIHLGGYGPTKEVCDRPEVGTEQEARFSAQYCIAALLVLGGVRLAAFEPAALADPAIRALMRARHRVARPGAGRRLSRPPRRQGDGRRCATGASCSATSPPARATPTRRSPTASCRTSSPSSPAPVVGAAAVAGAAGRALARGRPARPGAAARAHGGAPRRRVGMQPVPCRARFDGWNARKGRKRDGRWTGRAAAGRG